MQQLRLISNSSQLSMFRAIILPETYELTGIIINKPSLLHLVGCLYYLYFIIFFFRLGKQSQFIPLQKVVYFITLPFFGS